MMSKQKNIPPLNRDDPESLYNWVAYKISCPDFRNTIKDFTNDNCTIFIDSEEKSSYNDILFIQFKRLIIDLKNDILHEGKISKVEFNKIVERGINDEKYKKYFKLLGLENYEIFKKRMIKRNIELFKISKNQIKENKKKENQNEAKKEGNEIKETKKEVKTSTGNLECYHNEDNEEGINIQLYEKKTNSTPHSINQYFNQIDNKKINIDTKNIENEDSIIMEEEEENDEVLNKKI